MSVFQANGKSYDSRGRRLLHTGVNQANQSGNNFIVGDEFTDGSIVLRSVPSDPMGHVELRQTGVFNDTSFRFAASSVLVGRDLILAAVAGFIETGNPSGTVGHIRSLIPHTEFDDSGTRQPQTPILDIRELFDVFTSAVSEIVATTIGVNLGVSPGRALSISIHEVGSVGSTAEVTVTFYIGTDNTGVVIDKKMLPVNSMVAETTLAITYNNDLGFLAGQQIFMEFTSAANISLKTDSGGNPLTIHDGQELATLELLAENFMVDENLDLMFDENLNFLTAIQFP